MKLTLTLVVVLAAVAVALVLVSSGEEFGFTETPAGPAVAAPATQVESADTSPAAAGLVAPERVRVESRTNESTPSEKLEADRASPAPERRESGDAVLFGRCIDAHDRPVEGVDVRLLADPNEPARRTTQTDLAGRFEVSTPLQADTAMFLVVGGSGLGLQTFQDLGLERGARVDQGDIVVRQSGTAFVRVVETDGSPCVDAQWLSVNRDGGYPRVVRGDHTGSFRIDDLHPGKHGLGAMVEVGGIPPSEFRIAEGQELELEVVHRFSPTATHEAVASVEGVFKAEPLGGVRIAPQHVTLITPTGERRPAQRASTRFAFPGLRPGRYALEVSDPRFEPWYRDGIEPGPVPIEVQLLGEFALELAVVDASTGRAVEPYQADLDRWVLRAEGEAARPGGLYRGVTTRSSFLRVSAPGYRRNEQDLGALTPGAYRVARVQLTPLAPAESTLEGRLLAPEGTSLRGIRVALGTARNGVSAEVDERGAFVLGPVQSGPADLMLILPGGADLPRPSGDSMAALVGEGSRRSLAALELEPGVNRWKGEIGDLLPGAMQLHVRSDGVGLPNATVLLWCEDCEGGTEWRPEQIVTMTDAGGDVRCGAVAPGAWRVSVVLEGKNLSRHIEPGVLQVVSGQELEHRIDVQLVRGSLRVVAAESGEALADQELFLVTYMAGASLTMTQLETDADGRVELELLPGSYGLARQTIPSLEPQASYVPLEWTTQGPAEEVLVLPLRTE